MVDDPILVLAATGGQGKAVTDALLGRGAKVRAMVRNPESPAARLLAVEGVDVVTGSLSDRLSLGTAMEGVAGVFAYTTPFDAGVEAEVAQGRAILAAAGEKRVPHLVFSSVAGAEQGSGVPHFDSKARIEAELVSGDVPHTILGPTYFFDNALGGAQRLLSGALDLPLPSHKPLQQLARADHGAFAAGVLLNPAPYLGRRIELASDAPTPAQMAATLSGALGRVVRHEYFPLDVIGDPDMHAMWTFLDGPGYRVDIPTLHTAHPEISWTSFADWAQLTFAADH
ncbi:NmrA family transcriptional regulator [Streptomyces sp. AS58]|uniref:NmrA/HSCARG family protein n=1 Tax=Streptomyces sp. AS58 TaxID=1519489 RepID=UPI0006ADDFED|nr:NmrA/HSCARG family protein [Streptomyces sp. AS58]KOV74826.1 NmrA family transcriptional regulator [Streptomyces sp. AS58]